MEDIAGVWESWLWHRTLLSISGLGQNGDIQGEADKWNDPVKERLQLAASVSEGLVRLRPFQLDALLLKAWSAGEYAEFCQQRYDSLAREATPEPPIFHKSTRPNKSDNADSLSSLDLVSSISVANQSQLMSDSQQWQMEAASARLSAKKLVEADGTPLARGKLLCVEKDFETALNAMPSAPNGVGVLLKAALLARFKRLAEAINLLQMKPDVSKDNFHAILCVILLIGDSKVDDAIKILSAQPLNSRSLPEYLLIADLLCEQNQDFLGPPSLKAAWDDFANSED